MIMRSEHPNPQFYRENWKNLNGEWQFAIDNGRSGKDRKMFLPDCDPSYFDKTINVPFCPESKLSGIGNKDFMLGVWYRRTFIITKKQLEGSVLLRIGACDYKSEVFLNGESLGAHIGGYSSFTLKLDRFLKEGENTLVIYAEDDPRQNIARGKQCDRYYSRGCLYTRTTGIWQTVYLEFVPRNYIKNFRVQGDVAGQCVTISGTLCGGGNIKAQAFYEGKKVGEAQREAKGAFNFVLPLSELHLWELGDGKLYNLELTFGDDKIKSYFGMRDIGLDKTGFYLNGKNVFQRLVLDQGFYPEGIYTAKDVDQLVLDIDLSMQAGFNGARLHEKVFEPLFLYYCDKKGYMVWGEYGNWGMDVCSNDALNTFAGEWVEVLERDVNHPSIIGWCPMNETWNDKNKAIHDHTLENIYAITKAYDPTRPCIDVSGYCHTRTTDFYDVHDYDTDPVSMREKYKKFKETGEQPDSFTKNRHQDYINGEPLFISEYGGIGLSVGDGAWSYGNASKTEEEFHERYRGLTEAILDNPDIYAFCYTQLYDVEQEQNGLYTYDGRAPKVDISRIRAVNTKKAACEE